MAKEESKNVREELKALVLSLTDEQARYVLQRILQDLIYELSPEMQVKLRKNLEGNGIIEEEVTAKA